MKTKDRIKEEIGLEKLIMTLLVAVVSSLSNWIWGNYEILPTWSIVLIYSFIGSLLVTSITLLFKINSKIKELDIYE